MRHLACHHHAKQVGRACAIGSRVGLRIAAMGAAILSSVAIGIFGFLASSGVSLDFLRPGVEQLVASRADADSVSIEGIHIRRDQAGRTPFRLTLSGIHLDGGAAGEMDIPAVSLRLGAGPLLRGATLPSYVEVDGASISIERRGGEVSVGGQTGDGASFDLAGFVNSARRAGFRGAILKNASVRLYSAETDTLFEVSGGRAEIWEQAGGYEIAFSVPYTGGETDGEMTVDAFVDPATRTAHAKLRAVDVPASSILSLIVGENQQLTIDSLVTGTVVALGDFDDGLTELRLSLSMGAGEVGLSGRRLPLRSIALEGGYAPQSKTLSLDGLQYALADNRGHVSGTAVLEMSAAGLDGVAFDLEAMDLVVDPGGVLPAPVPVPQATMLGRLDLAQRALRVEAVDAAYFGARVLGRMDVLLSRDPAVSPGIEADLDVIGRLSPTDVLRGWPVAAAQGARQWIERNLSAAEVTDIRYAMAIPMGALSSLNGGGLPDPFVDLSFRVADAEVVYVPGMTPLTELSATASLRGNSFYLTAESGRVGKVELTGGTVEMPQFVPKGADAVFKFEAGGELADILGIVDQPPLGFISAAGMSPADFSGRAAFDFTVYRPLLGHVPMTDYRFAGTGSFQRLSLDEIGPGFHLTGGRGTLDISEKGMTITGDVQVEGVPTNFTWRRDFGGDMALSLVASASLDSRAADRIGVPLRRFMRGQVDATLRAVGFGDGFDRIEIIGDLLNAGIAKDDTTFLKPIGVPGNVIVTANLRDEGAPIRLETVSLRSEAFLVEAEAVVAPDGMLISADFDRLFVDGAIDLGGTFRRDPAGVSMSFAGPFLDASPIIETLFSGQAGGGAGLPGEIALNAKIDTVALRGGVALTDAHLDLRHGGAAIENVALRGRLGAEGMASLEVAPHPMGLGQDVRVVTDRFGTLLQGVFEISSVDGGEAMFKATFLDDGPLAGTLRATDLQIINAPTVAKLLSVGSLEGLSALANGSGLPFQELQGDIQYQDGVLKVVDARLTGTALGLSANGEVDLADNMIDLRGAVAPVYGVNSVLGDVPALGEILVSRKGEGLLAFGYGVIGEMAEPTVSVNTLTALTPGIFRRLFEPVADHIPTTDEILAAAEAAAGVSEAQSYLSTPELLQEYARDLDKRPPSRERR